MILQAVACKLPVDMVKLIDKHAARELEPRSAFIRAAILDRLRRLEANHKSEGSKR